MLEIASLSFTVYISAITLHGAVVLPVHRDLAHVIWSKIIEERRPANRLYHSAYSAALIAKIVPNRNASAATPNLRRDTHCSLLRSLNHTTIIYISHFTFICIMKW